MNKNFIIVALILLASILVLSRCGVETYAQGKRIYEAKCANCHMEDGSGLALLIPPLAKSDYLALNQDKVPCIILHGQIGKITVNRKEYNQEMPAEQYNEVQITNVINYINTAWGNQLPAVSLAETKKRLEDCSL